MTDGLFDRLQTTRKRIFLDLLKTERTAYFSAATYSLNKALTTAIRRSVRGRVLDCGAGLQPYRRLIEAVADSSDSIDWNEADGLTYVGDVQSMDMIADRLYDTVFCSQVLEHVPRPADALAEMFRVLKPGGSLVISVPHLSRLHEQPHDYFRYTRFGLQSLLERSGFEVDRISAVGGLLSFLAHQVSTVVLGLTWGIPLLRRLIFLLNRLLLVYLPAGIDRILPGNHLFPLNHLAIACRPER